MTTIRIDSRVTDIFGYTGTVVRIEHAGDGEIDVRVRWDRGLVTVEPIGFLQVVEA